MCDVFLFFIILNVNLLCYSIPVRDMKITQFHGAGGGGGGEGKVEMEGEGRGRGGMGEEKGERFWPGLTYIYILRGQTYPTFVSCFVTVIHCPTISNTVGEFPVLLYLL